MAAHFFIFLLYFCIVQSWPLWKGSWPWVRQLSAGEESLKWLTAPGVPSQGLGQQSPPHSPHSPVPCPFNHTAHHSSPSPWCSQAQLEVPFSSNLQQAPFHITLSTLAFMLIISCRLFCLIPPELGFPGGSAVKRRRLDSWVGKIPWRRAWQPTPVFFSWKIPWTEEPGQLQSTGSQTFEHDWSNRACTDAPRLGYALFERGKEVCLFPTTSAQLKFSTEISIPHTYSWSSRNACR